MRRVITSLWDVSSARHSIEVSAALGRRTIHEDDNECSQCLNAFHPTALLAVESSFALEYLESEARFVIQREWTVATFTLYHHRITFVLGDRVCHETVLRQSHAFGDLTVGREAHLRSLTVDIERLCRGRLLHLLIR